MGVINKNAQNNLQPKGNKKDLKKPLQVLHISKKDTQKKFQEIQNEQTNSQEEIKNENIESKCGWSPFNDVEFKGTPVATIIAGKIKMKDGKILGDPEGTPLKFS